MVKRLCVQLRQAYSSTLARNAGWIFLGQGFSSLLLAAYVVVLSRLLGVREFGLLAGATAFVQIFSPYASLGSGLVFMRYVSTDRALHGLYFGNILLTTGSLGTILVVGLGILAPHIWHSDSARVVVPLAISECLCSAITSALSQVFQTREMPRKMTLISFLNNLLRLGTAVTLLVVSSHATAQLWANANLGVSAVVCVLVVLLVSKELGMPRFSLPLSIRKAAEGSAFALSYSANSIYNDFDKTMLSHYGMYAANGVYSAAYRVIGMATMPAYSIEMAALPRLFQRRAKGLKDVIEYGNNLLKKSLLVGVLLTLILLVSAPLLPLLLGSGFAESASVLRWLALLPLFRSAHLILGSTITGAGLQHFRTGIQLVIAGFNFVINLWLIPHHGWMGAAWSSLATDGLLIIVYVCLIRFWLRRQEGFYSKAEAECGVA